MGVRWGVPTSPPRGMDMMPIGSKPSIASREVGAFMSIL